jgi:multidrug resistance efflux pump
LAQRIPVHIDIDYLPAGVTLAASLTATVEVEPRAQSGDWTGWLGI